MSKYAKAPATTDTFPKNGDAGPEVTNVSGAPSPNTQPVGRRAGGPTSPDTGGQNKSNRTPIMIDAETGRLLDSHMAQGLAHAAHRADQEHFAGQRDTSPAAYLAHVFGTNLPGRDRA